MLNREQVDNEHAKLSHLLMCCHDAHIHDAHVQYTCYGYRMKQEPPQEQWLILQLGLLPQSRVVQARYVLCLAVFCLDVAFLLMPAVEFISSSACLFLIKSQLAMQQQLVAVAAALQS